MPVMQLNSDGDPLTNQVCECKSPNPIRHRSCTCSFSPPDGLLDVTPVPPLVNSAKSEGTELLGPP